MCIDSYGDSKMLKTSVEYVMFEFFVVRDSVDEGVLWLVVLAS